MRGGREKGRKRKDLLFLSSRERNPRSHQLNCSHELWKAGSTQRTEDKQKRQRRSWKSGLVPRHQHILVTVKGLGCEAFQAIQGLEFSTNSSTRDCFKGSKGAAISSKDKQISRGHKEPGNTDENTETEESLLFVPGASKACPGDGEVGGLLVQARLARPYVWANGAEFTLKSLRWANSFGLGEGNKGTIGASQ